MADPRSDLSYITLIPTDDAAPSRVTLADGQSDAAATQPATAKEVRLHIVLKGDLYDAVRVCAAKNQTSVNELVRRFIKLGLLASAIEEDPESALLIRERGELTRLRLL